MTLFDFVLTRKTLPFTDKEIISLDRKLSKFEQIILNPDIEENLITKNEILASFAISKAENSTLTLTEAQDVYNLIKESPNFNFLNEKIKNQKILTQKDHDKLEFFNIAKIFKSLGALPFNISDLTSNFIKNIHAELTLGLDIFSKYLANFTPYKSGKWRDNNEIRIGSYIPSNFFLIDKSVKELVSWIKKDPTPTNIAIFHTAFYALHPFNNGNKRVSRILEHLLLRSIGLNSKNLYSTSYYYHKEKERYYKYLFYSLERKNLNHFTAFVQESIVLSIISVVKTSLESKRLEYLNKQEIDNQIKLVLKPLIKRKEVQFKNLFKISKRKLSRQTFVNYLEKAVNQKIILKRESGRSTYYSLKFSAVEEETLKKWMAFASKRLSFVPDNIKFY